MGAETGQSAHEVGGELLRPYKRSVAEAGLETVDLTSWITNNFGRCGIRSAAESGAVGLDSVSIDADLAALIEAWPNLSEGARKAIMGMIETVGH